MVWEGISSLSMLLLKGKQVEGVQRCSIKVKGESLTPVMEGPTPEEFENSRRKGSWTNLQHWMKGQFSGGTASLSWTPSMGRTSSVSAYKRSDLRLLLGVLGAPLAPVAVSSEPIPSLLINDNTSVESSSAGYIVQQYIAATGVSKFQKSIRSCYVLGKVKMFASEFETAAKLVKSRNPSKDAETGGFVLWQMLDKWYVELAVGGSKVHAGSDGKLVWRHTPWLGTHAAKGPVRPLRRLLQGLDPRIIGSLFANARCIGEKKIRGEDCFTLKLAADQPTLLGRSDGPAEIIRHVMFGFFSQKTGLLVHLEDSHLTRIQSTGGDAIYWETTIDSSIEDYRSVDGIMIAHSGRSVVTVFRFGEMAMSHMKSRMEERWSIEEVAFNVPGLSEDCFIPPADIRRGSVSEVSELPPHLDKGKCLLSSGSSKVAALEKPQENLDNIIWRVEV